MRNCLIGIGVALLIFVPVLGITLYYLKGVAQHTTMFYKSSYK